MKNILLWIVCLLSFNIIYTQNTIKGSIQTLDQLNGFKDIKLGSPLSNWNLFGDIITQQELQFSWIDKENETTTYKYVGYGYERMFDIEIDGLFLEFDKDDLLIKILILINSPNSTENPNDRKKIVKIDAVFSNLTTAFGSPTSMYKLSNRIHSIWTGSKVKLVMMKYYNQSEPKLVVSVSDRYFQRVDTGF